MRRLHAGEDAVGIRSWRRIQAGGKFAPGWTGGGEGRAYRGSHPSAQASPAMSSRQRAKPSVSSASSALTRNRRFHAGRPFGLRSRASQRPANGEEFAPAPHPSSPERQSGLKVCIDAESAPTDDEAAGLSAARSASISSKSATGQAADDADQHHSCVASVVWCPRGRSSRAGTPWSSRRP